MAKRLLDFAVAGVSLVILSPLLGVVAFLTWLEDRGAPFYISPRVGRRGRVFRMVKFRSMVVDADRSGVSSTSMNDSRVTSIGALVRRYKLDELPQLWNVLCGEMSLVGPRPNVPSEVKLYTGEERRLLDVRPGITDLASIVFADEAEILRGASDPDREYGQLIRPWKSRLGLLYVENCSPTLDVSILFATALALLGLRATALDLAVRIARKRGAGELLCSVMRRNTELVPCAPPGDDEPVNEARGVTSRWG